MSFNDEVLVAPAFVIHLVEKTPERRPFFEHNLAEAGFTDVRIFPAVNAYDDAALNAAMQECGNPKIHSTVNRGGQGCLLSHLTLLMHICNHNIPRATIFEDDVLFHPQWNELAPQYYADTPQNYDVVFIGNQIDECLGDGILPDPINCCSNFCTHAYIVTHKGARKLIHLLLGWDWWSRHTAHVLPTAPPLRGLYYIDCMIKNIQTRINRGKLPAETLRWYCWCGMQHPCDHNRRPLCGDDTRNTGIVFQCEDFPTLVSFHGGKGAAPPSEIAVGSPPFIELVVSRYNESMEWINTYPFNQFHGHYVVYNKGDSEDFCHDGVKAVRHIPNLGWCDHTYIYHIVHNYDRLASITVFLPASVDMDAKLAQANNVLKYIIYNQRAVFWGHRCPEGVAEMCKDFKLDHYKCANPQNAAKNSEVAIVPCKIRPFGKWYRAFFGDLKTTVLSYWGVFSVDRRDIVRHSKLQYETLLGALTLHSGSNGESGHFVERSWGAIFHPFTYTKVAYY